MVVAITTAAGAVLTTLLGVLVGSVLASRAQRRQWSRNRQADACAQVLRESSGLLIEFTRLLREPIAPVPDGAYVPTPLDWRPWNEALAMVDLVSDHEIVEAAHALDEQIWRAHQQVKRGWVLEGRWPEVRELVEARRRDFVNTVRRKLAGSGPSLRRLDGRPASNDPVWEFRRSYFTGGDKAADEHEASSTDGSAP